MKDEKLGLEWELTEGELKRLLDAKALIIEGQEYYRRDQVEDVIESEASQLKSRIEELQRENQEFERLKSENSRLRKACEVVVKGYENDGMEDMSFRDRVFYQACKEALEKEK